jgi:SAM-dependent methyltransferase
MASKTKTDVWEEQFSDNFDPGTFIKLIQKYEKYRLDVMVELLPKKGKVLVDLACGDGKLIFKAKDRFTKLIGFDIAENRIRNAKKHARGERGFTFKVADLDQGIPLPDKSVDVITCEAAIGCFYDVEFMVREIHRVLKPKGIFILESPNFAYLPRRVSLGLGNLPKCSAFPGFGDGGLIHYFTYSVMEELLREGGFKVEVVTNSGVWPSLRRFWPSLLAGDMIFKVRKI